MRAAPARLSTSRLLGARAASVLLLLGLAGGGAALAAPPTVVGIAAAVVKDVRIKGAAARQFAAAALRQRVALADQVQTGSASRLQLLLLDKSKFSVGANARLTIDRFVYDPNGGSISASVAKGAFRFMSGRAGGRKAASIGTPSASIGIRGTLLDGVVGDEAVAIARGEREIRGNPAHDPATATLVVLRGPGPRSQGNDGAGVVDVTAAGQTVTLDGPLEAAYVPRAGAPPIAFTISSPGVARLNDLLLEPRELLANPDAPGQPYMPPPDRGRPDFYGGPPPGGYDDGPGPGAGGYVPGGIPGMNAGPGFPQGMPPGRPQRQPAPPRNAQPTPPRAPLPATGPTAPPPPAPQSPPTTTGPAGTPPPAPDPGGGSLYLPDTPPPRTAPPPSYPPTTGPSPSPNDPPRTGPSPSPNYPPTTGPSPSPNNPTRTGPSTTPNYPPTTGPAPAPTGSPVPGRRMR